LIKGQRTGLITAQGLFSQKIAGRFKGPCPASAAHVFEFTFSAFSFQRFKIPQRQKDIRMMPDVGKGFSGNVSAVHIKKSAGLNDSPVGDETKPCASKTSSGYGIHPMGVECYRFFVFL
jgi:hypothetical protein